MSAGIMTGPYDIPVYHGRAVSVCTNKAPLGPYRGVGRSGACFAIETMIDAVAREVGRNPEDVRLENMVPAASMPYRSATGKLYDSGDYPGCAQRVLDAIDAPAIRRRQTQPEPDGRLIGLGIASYTEQTAHGTAEWVARGLPVVFGFEPATARFTPDGKLMVFVGIQNHGQGLETTLAQVAHQELGIPIQDVIVRHGDTGVSPYGMGTFASRSMTMAGGAVGRVSAMLAEKVERIGAGLLQAPADRCVGGRAGGFRDGLGDAAGRGAGRLPASGTPAGRRGAGAGGHRHLRTGREHRGVRLCHPRLHGGGRSRHRPGGDSGLRRLPRLRNDGEPDDRRGAGRRRRRPGDRNGAVRRNPL